MLEGTGSGQVGLGGRGKLQVPVGLILDDDHVVTAADGVDFLAAGEGDDEAGGVVAETIVLRVLAFCSKSL